VLNNRIAHTVFVTFDCTGGSSTRYFTVDRMQWRI